MTTVTAKRRVAVEKADSGKLKRDTIGSRIQKLRYQLALTQDTISKATDRGRSAVAQWERDDCEPPLSIIEKLAEVLETTPQYLAFGITGDAQVVAPDPTSLGYALVPEVQYGDKLADERELAVWGLPVSWLAQNANVSDFDGLRLFKAEYDVGPYQFGDRVLIDTHSTRVSPPGVFLHWDGIGPVLSQITPVHNAGKPMARVSGSGETYEVPVDQLQVIGRVRALWRKG